MAAPHPADAFAGRRFDALLLDLDGTLIDSRVAVETAWRRWAAAEHVEIAALDGSHGMPAAEIVARLLPEERVAEAIARILDYEAHQTDGVVARPGSAAALQALPADRVALVTSCTRTLAAVRGGAAGLKLPAVRVTIDDVARGKPAPDPFLAGARALGLAPARCLAVEDAPAGLAAARAAGCATLGVNGTHDLDELDADATAPDLAHLAFDVRPDGIAIGRAGS
jgi:sugar-phosphatase